MSSYEETVHELRSLCDRSGFFTRFIPQKSDVLPWSILEVMNPGDRAITVMIALNGTMRIFGLDDRLEADVTTTKAAMEEIESILRPKINEEGDG